VKKQKLIVIILSCLLAAETILLAYLIISRLAMKKKPPRIVKGTIAVVLDDWGYNLDNLTALAEINLPLTVAVLPNLPYSRKAAEAAHSQGKEIILHLPMQPRENTALEQKTILVSTEDKIIAETINQDLNNIIYARGISNHMGSLATTDTRLMRAVFRELKKRGLYFLDSFVADNIVSPGLARQMKLKTARRDIFLDNSDDPEYIRRQFNKLKIKSWGKGEAVGIGHDKKNTLAVLKKMMPELEKEGYKFVFLSELVK
jgi:polysaccharide deacetylase 2 family uncharacterized protein YibQ